MQRSLLLSLIFLAGLAQAQMQNPSAGPPRSMDPMNRQGYPQDDQLTKMDEKRFVKDALLDGMTEVELGKVALEKASGESVKQFAQKMIDDHSKANEELKQIASVENMGVPGSLDSRHQSRIEKLSKLSGAEFDRAYIKEHLKENQQDVREFQQESQSGNSPAVKTFASKTLPMLQDHLSLAKELDKGKKTSASK